MKRSVKVALPLLVAAALASYFMLPVSHMEGAGPLLVGGDGYALADPGVYSVGFQPCTVDGESVHVSAVEIEDSSGEVVVVGVVQRRRPAGSVGVGALEGFPPDVEGAVWEPVGSFAFTEPCEGEPDEVAVGLEFGAGGGIVDGLTVHYRVGLRRFQNTAPFQIVRCGDSVRGLHLMCGG